MSTAQRAKLTVREAVPEDNDALVALANQCPMDGDISLCVDRAPDFFTLNRLEGDPWKVGVVDGPDGTPIACVGVARRHLHVDGVPTHVAYIGDLKVHPDHRRSRIGLELAVWATAAAVEMVGEDGLKLSTVLKGNNPIETAMASIPREVFPTTPRGTIRSHSIQLLTKRRPPRGLIVDRAVSADIAQMAQLWGEIAPARQLSPVLDEQAFAQWIEDGPGLSAADYLVARRPGDDTIVGFLGLWDQHVFKQMRVTAYSPTLSKLRRLFNAFAPLTRASKLPAPGGEFRYRTVVNLCVRPGDTDTLRALVFHAYERLRGNGYSFFTLGLDMNDPLNRALRLLYSQPTDVTILVDHVVERGDAPTLGDAPLHFEIATV